MFRLALVLFGLVLTVMAGIGLMIVLSVPGWSSKAMTLIPHVLGAALVLSLPTTWLITRLIFNARTEGM